METPLSNPPTASLQPPQNISEVPPAKKGKFFLIIGIVFLIILGIVLYYLLIQRNYQQITTPSLKTQKQNPIMITPFPLLKTANTTITRPSKQDILASLKSAENTTSVTSFPYEKIVEFIYPFFYAPNDYKYEKMSALFTYYPDLSEKESHPIKDSIIYLHITGETGDFSDKYMIALVINTATKTVETMSLNSSPQEIPNDLRSSLNQKLKAIPEIKQFTDKYHLSGGIYAYYRPEVPSLNYSDHFSMYDVQLNKNYIFTRFIEGGGGIPENPKEELDAVIDPVTMSLLKIKQ